MCQIVRSEIVQATISEDAQLVLPKKIIEFMGRHQIGTVRDHAAMLILLTYYLEILENSGGGATTEMDHSVTLMK